MVTLATIEKAAILERLKVCGYNVTGAAKTLGIGKTTLYRKLKAWGLQGPYHWGDGNPLDIKRKDFVEWTGRIGSELENIS